MRCFEIGPQGSLAQQRHLLVRYQHQANQLLSLVNCTFPLIFVVILVNIEPQTVLVFAYPGKTSQGLAKEGPIHLVRQSHQDVIKKNIFVNENISFAPSKSFPLFCQASSRASS